MCLIYNYEKDQVNLAFKNMKNSSKTHDRKFVQKFHTELSSYLYTPYHHLTLQQYIVSRIQALLSNSILPDTYKSYPE